MRDAGKVVTVTGAVDPSTLGHTQMHEHIVCDTSRYVADAVDGAPVTLANYYRARFDWDCADNSVLDDVDVAAAELARYVAAGGGTVVDMTSLGMGRDPLALRDLAERVGVTIVMGCGYYGSMFHPPEVAKLSEAELAERIARDVLVGVGDTGVRAGVIGEIGMTAPTHPDEVKVLRAAVAAQRRTGAALNIHPGRDPAAPMEYLRIVADAGGDPRRTIMSHIERTLVDLDSMLEVAETGCVLEFDMFGMESSYFPLDATIDVPNDAMRVAYLRQLIEAGHRDRVVVSQDVCRKTQLVAYGGEGYEHILRRAVPLMLRRGLDEDDVRAICVDNPASLLTICGERGDGH